ncbi:hypothetical protein ACOMHN_036251 [Nucella lapillus]
MQASIRTDISEKLSRQALSGSTGGPSRKSKCFGDGDRQSEQERTTRAANQPGEEEQNGSRDRPSAQGDRPDRSVEPSRKQEQTGTGGDRQTRGQENVTHRPSKGIEKTDDRGSRSNYQEMLVFNTQAEGNRRSSSLHTQPSQCMQVTADRKAQPPDSYARIPEMSVPPAKGHAMAPQIPEMSVPPAQGHAVAPQGPAQIHPKTHTGNAGSMEMHKYNKYPIPAHVAQLLQVPDVIDKFKAKLMDKQCLVDCQSVPGGFIMIKEDSREEDVSSTLRELLHQEVIEVGEDDQDVEKALNSLREKYAGKVSCVSEEGRWNICVTADIKEDIHGEVEKLQQAQCLVPLPLYAAELLALDIDRVHGDIKRDVDSSVRVNITDGEGKQGVELSSARKFIKQAVQWMHDFVLELEITNRALSVSEALFFQDLEGQNMIQKVEGGEFCRIDAVVDEDWSGLCATSPSGQRLLVCRDAMAATDCDCIVLPLWKGQTEWTPLQRWILRRSLLSENITSYQEWCQENPISLLGSADFQGKTIIIVPVPAWEDGAAKEKEKITNFYKQAFEMCGKNQHSVGVCAKQCAKQSPSISFRKSLTALLCAVWETFSTQDPPSTTCKTVVMYTDSAQEAKVTCQAVTQGLPQGWRVKPPRAPRPRSGKGIIEVCLGEIQKTKADVIVNSTNRKLICDQGAVEKAIGETAGPEMYKACRELYPQGIPENGLAITNSFRMENAKRIYHIALSQDIFDGDKQRVLLYNLRQVILHCLVKASLEEHATIAFPTLGSGMLQYPCDVVASTMFSTIHTFFTEMPHTTLQKVIIVVFPKNLPAIQAFKMEEISRLYTFSTEEKRATYEMQMNLKSHKIQVIHGNVFQEPWVSDFCVHGKLASERGESPSKVQGCQSIVVDTREDYRKYVRTALLRARTVQIAADTLRSETLTDLALALESVLSQDKQGHCLVSVVFSDEEKAMKFQQSFKDVECGHVVPGEGKRNRGQMFVCSYKGGEEMARKIEEFEVSPRYKELLKVYRESGADQAQKEGENERGDNKEPDQVSISLPKSFLENVNLAQILKVQFTRAEREGMTNISVRLTDLVNTAKALAEGIGNKPFEKESGGSEKVSGPGEESESTDGWERNLDEFQVEALKYLLREEFDQTFDMKKNQDGVLLTFKGASSRALENQVDSLRREDVQLNPEEVAKLDDIVDVRSEGVEAFVRTVRNMDKATVFALDYTAMSKAKHLVNVRAGRVKVTARSRRRFETGNSGPPDQATPQTGGMLHGAGSDVQTKIFTTPSGVKVSVYKTDITKLPVDAIVNAANEHLAHGGGVAYYISKAAGFALEEEGREHLRKHGDLIVTDVVATTAGSLPCQKVLHAVGPRWVSYQDKAQCQQLLVDTVFNCLYKAHSLGFTSLALPSISAAIFGVPQPICAQSYLSAVKKFDTIHGHSTPLKEIHFVDINDGMTSVIQSTFSADWSVPASSTPGNQGVEAAAGVRNRQEESSRPVHSLPAASQENRLDMLPKEGPRPRQGPESGNQGQPPGHTAGLQDEPAGFPCLTERWSEKENQVQVVFKDRDLTLIFQKQSVTDIETESVILWQDVQNIMRDNIWKQFVKKLSPQAKTRTHMINKEMSTADKTYTFRTTNKQYVFIVTSSRGSCGEEKIRDFVEQAFNRVDLDKTSVAIPRKQKEEKAKKELQLCEIEISKNIELISGALRLQNEKKATVAAFYRPPSRTDEAYTTATRLELQQLRRKVKQGILIIGGDFNTPDIDWNMLSIAGNQYPIHVNQTLLDFVADSNMEQQVDFPTRQKKTLELILTTHPSLKTRCKALPSVGNSDHDVVLYDTSLRPFRPKPPKRKILLWKKANVHTIRKDMEEYAQTFDIDTSKPDALETAWRGFSERVQKTINKNVPSKTTQGRYSYPWIDTSLRRAIRRKQRAHTKARDTGKKRDQDRYKRLQQEVKDNIKKASHHYLDTVVTDDFKTNSKKLWAYVKSKGQESQGVSPLKNTEGYLKSDNCSKAEILNNQFKSVFTEEDLSHMPDKGDSPYQAMDDITVTEKGVQTLLRNLQPNKATGPDSIPAFILKAVKNYAERANRSIREIHVGEPDLDILRFMGDKVKTLIGIDQSLLDQKKSQPSSSQSASPASSTAHSPDPCSICHSEPDNPKALTCGHVFCTSCIDQWFQTKPTCPTCNSIQGTVRGDQPKDGIMGMKYSSFSACDGFPQGMYTVDYWFPSGKQKENHPNPGKWYNSTRRIAFLPDTAEGRKVLMLLKVAFDRRLIFTVGKSATTDSVGIIWNDIHHKTLCSGGAESHGYPDPTYLTRVQEELAAKGVTEKDLTNVQHDFIANPAKVQSQYRYDFSDYFGTPV